MSTCLIHILSHAHVCGKNSISLCDQIIKNPNKSLFFAIHHWFPYFLWILPFIELDDRKIYRKALYLMVKTVVSCRFSLKPIHWSIDCSISSSFLWIHHGFRQNVVEIAAGHRAFAVRRGDGTVISWGDELLGGDCSAVPKRKTQGTQ